MAEDTGPGYNGSNERMAPDIQELHLKDIIGVLIARRRILLSAFLAVFLSAAVYAVIAEPFYTSAAMVLIEPNKMNLGDIKDVYDPTAGGVGGAISMREYFSTQLALILNRDALQKTFDHFDYGLMSEFKDSKDPLAKFEKYFSVSEMRNTRLANVSFEWKDPTTARETLKYQLDEFISANNQRALGMTFEGLETLRLKAKDLSPRVDVAAAALQDFMVENNMVSLEETQNIVVERLKQISAELVRTENERIQFSSVLESLKNIKRENISLDSVPEAVESATIRDLKVQQTKTQQELSGLEGQYGVSHPEVMSLRSRLSSLNSKMNSELRIIFESAEQKYQRADKRLQDLKAALSEQEKKVHKLNQLGVRYQKLKETHETLKETFRVVDKRIKEIEISLTAGPKNSNIFIVEPPTIPLEKSRPKRLKILLLGMLGGLALGAMLSFFVEYFDTTIKTKEEAENITGFPVLGFVPPLEVEGTNGNGAGHHVKAEDLSHWNNSRSSISEAFRSVRTSLDFFCPEEKKVILITSPSPSEGKTTVSIHIALSYAKAGKRTILIDADMRKPRLAKVFKISAQMGLSQLLVATEISGSQKLKQAIVTNAAPKFPQLSLISSGPTPPNPAEMLAGAAMPALLEKLKVNYDVIVIDTPPVGRVTDAAVLAKHVDAVVFVARNLKTERKMLGSSSQLLKQGCGKIGIVLNHADMIRRGYYDSNYYYYYYGGSYYGDLAEEKPAGWAENVLEKLGLRQ